MERVTISVSGAFARSAVAERGATHGAVNFAPAAGTGARPVHGARDSRRHHHDRQGEGELDATVQR